MVDKADKKIVDKDDKKRDLYGIVTAVIGILTYATSAYFEYQHKKDLAGQHKIEISNAELTELIHRQEDAYQAIDSAITNIRQVRTNIRLTCERFPEKIHDQKFLLENDIARYAAGYNLILAQGLADFVFSEEMRNQIKIFNGWEIATTSEKVCNGQASSDSEYEKRQSLIEQIMQKSIQETKKRIK